MSKIKLDVDLNEMFQLSYGFEPLKLMLEKIVNVTNQNDDKITDLYAKLEAQQDKVLKIHNDDSDDQNKRIEGLLERIMVLEEEMKDSHNKIAKNK